MDAAIFGLIVADVIAEPMNLRAPPKPGGLAFTNSVQLTTGGNVCNTGIAMAKLGMKVAAAGLVGNDVLGAAVTERLRQAGLDTTAVFTSDKGQTSAALVGYEEERRPATTQLVLLNRQSPPNRQSPASENHSLRNSHTYLDREHLRHLQTNDPTR